VCFEVTFEGVIDGETLMAVGIWFSRGESTTSKIGFCPANVKERLARGTERTTGLMVGYEFMKVGICIYHIWYG